MTLTGMLCDGSIASMSDFLWLGPFFIIYTVTIIFILGLLIGSFLNVCIYRIPLGQNIAISRSHCMKCGHVLKWYELIPLFSWLIQGGKCRACKEKISKQYPIVELSNALSWMAILVVWGYRPVTILYCACASCMIVISVIDERTKEINLGLNIFIGVLGLARVALDYRNWYYYLIGMLAVSIPFLIIVIISKERAMGLGDVYLMAAAGLLLGWKHVLLATVLGCALGSIIHIIRMKVSKKGNELAFGPYLCLGIYLTFLFGEPIIRWYTSFIVH